MLCILFLPLLSLLVCFLQSEVQSMSEAQTAQRDDSPMDVDQPSPLEQDLAPLGMTRFEFMTFNLSL